LDQKGTICLVWSGYDGQDYEIYSRFWDGRKWGDEIKVTNNSQKNDVFPSLAVVSNDIPIVVWAQAEKDESHIFFKFLESDSWSKEIKISSSRNPNASPEMAVDGNKIGILWLCQNEINSRIFTFDYLKTLNTRGESQARKGKAEIQANASLDEEKYIGYGDSITYGTIQGEDAPEKGYIPRLEFMLDQSFGETTVVNEGVGSENTLGGLSRIDGVLEKHNARFLLLMEGTNDLWNNKISAETTAFNLEEMVKKCSKIGVIPSIATIIPRPDEKWNWAWYRNKTFDLNEKIKDLAEELPIPFIDQFNLFYLHPEDEGGWRSLYSDRNHPNELGYQMMAEEWFADIKNFPFPPLNVIIPKSLTKVLLRDTE